MESKQYKLSDEKLSKYLLEILDDELMYNRLKNELKRGRTVVTAIFYTMRDRDTDRALNEFKKTNQS